MTSSRYGQLYLQRQLLLRPWLSYTRRPLTHGPDKLQALEGKNVKEMLLNVGSGGGAAAAPTGGAGATATEVPAEEAKEEKKEEGTVLTISTTMYAVLTSLTCRKRRIGRRHGIWFI